jgi:hypothetical protein
VVVNNRNRVVDGDGLGPADHVVAEIVGLGGSAVADYSDAASSVAGDSMVGAALSRHPKSEWKENGQADGSARVTAGDAGLTAGRLTTSPLRKKG